MDNLGRRFACSDEVQVVLYDLVKELRFLSVALLVAAALFEDVGDLLVGTAFARPNFPDALQQLIEMKVRPFLS